MYETNNKINLKALKVLNVYDNEKNFRKHEFENKFNLSDLDNKNIMLEIALQLKNISEELHSLNENLKIKK